MNVGNKRVSKFHLTKRFVQSTTKNIFNTADVYPLISSFKNLWTYGWADEMGFITSQKLKF